MSIYQKNNFRADMIARHGQTVGLPLFEAAFSQRKENNKMGKLKFLEVLRKLIAKYSWRVFLRASNLTEEQYFQELSNTLPPSEREKKLENMVRSACAIAVRRGVDTNWNGFINAIHSLGLNSFTANTFRLPK